MLTVSALQIEALGAEVEQRFGNRLSHFIEELFPGELEQMAARAGREGQGRQQAVARALELGRGFGIQAWSDLAVFTGLLVANFRFGRDGAPGFLRWTREILELSDLDGQAKLALIEDELRQQSAMDDRAAALCPALDRLRKAW